MSTVALPPKSRNAYAMVKSSKLDRAIDHARGILENKLSNKLKFHNLRHTLDVISAVHIIGEKSNLDPGAMEVVVLAAWYHDTGFSKSYQNHEYESRQIAAKFLKQIDYPTDVISKILGCIRATRIPQKPLNLLERIICDADLFHLSQSDYWTKNKLLREELSLVFSRPIRDDQWCYENLNFLCQHDYHTPYGKEVLARLKNKHLKRNIEKLEALIKKA
ncbi:MAG: HD domain-containing protein [Cyclobacteriaceae bacterium]